MDSNILASLSSPASAASAERPNRSAANAKAPTRRDDATAPSKSFGEELAATDGRSQSDRPRRANGPEKEARAGEDKASVRAGKPAGKDGEKTDKSDGDKTTNGSSDAPRADGKAGRSKSLEKVGALIRKGGDAGKSSRALALMTGNQAELDPATIPDIITKNGFIGEALGEGISEVMGKKHSVSEMIEMLEIPNRVIDQAKAQGLDLDEEVNAIDFFKAIGIDPQRIVVELTRLRDGMGQNGLAPYMSRDGAMIDKVPAPGMPNPGQVADDMAMRRKREQGAEPGITLPPGSIIPPSIGQMPTAMSPGNVPEQGSANKAPPSQSGIGAVNSRQIEPGTDEEGFAAPLALTPSGFNPPIREMMNGLQASAPVSPEHKVAVHPAEIGVFPSSTAISQNVGGIPNPMAEVAAASALTSASSLGARPNAEPAGRGIFVDSELVSPEDLAGSTSIMIQSLNADGTTAARPAPMNFHSLADQLSRTRLGLESTLKLSTGEIASQADVAPTIDAAPAEIPTGAKETTARPMMSLSTALSQNSFAEASPLEGQAKTDLALQPEPALTSIEAQGPGRGTADSSSQDSRDDRSAPDRREKSDRDVAALGTNVLERGTQSVTQSDSPQKVESPNQDLSNRIMERISEMAKHKKSEAVINVDSQEMGRITIALHVEDNQVSIRLVNGSERVKHVLGGDLARLQDSLAAQNLRLADVQMGTGREFLGSGSQEQLGQQLQQQFSQQQSANGRNMEQSIPRAITKLGGASPARGDIGRLVSTSLNSGRIQVMA